MLRFGRYVRAANVEDALEVLKFRKGAQVMGGGMWMRLSRRAVPCVIDLSDCGLDKIEETDGEYRIGAYVTLREVEVDERLNRATGNVLNAALRDIVGVQFRQLATVGGSVFGRFGFSDVICALLALDTEVELVDAGRVPLATFIDMPYELDILTHIIIHKHDYRASYQCVRKAATDFATANVCAARWDGTWHLSVGARPAKARLICGDALGVTSETPTPAEIESAVAAVRDLTFSSNLWGSARYRRQVAGVLAARAIAEAASPGSPEAHDAARTARNEKEAC